MGTNCLEYELTWYELVIATSSLVTLISVGLAIQMFWVRFPADIVAQRSDPEQLIPTDVLLAPNSTTLYWLMGGMSWYVHHGRQEGASSDFWEGERSVLKNSFKKVQRLEKQPVPVGRIIFATTMPLR